MAKVRFAGEFPGAQQVSVAGDFNGWDPTARRMRRGRKDGDRFVAVVDLEPGRHEFRYVVDGQWTCCPHSARVPNGMGTENSVAEVSG